MVRAQALLHMFDRSHDVAFDHILGQPHTDGHFGLRGLVVLAQLVQRHILFTALAPPAVDQPVSGNLE